MGVHQLPPMSSIMHILPGVFELTNWLPFLTSVMCVLPDVLEFICPDITILVDWAEKKNKLLTLSTLVCPIFIGFTRCVDVHQLAPILYFCGVCFIRCMSVHQLPPLFYFCNVCFTVCVGDHQLAPLSCFCNINMFYHG